MKEFVSQVSIVEQNPKETQEQMLERLNLALANSNSYRSDPQAPYPISIPFYTPAGELKFCVNWFAPVVIGKPKREKKVGGEKVRKKA